MGAGAEEPLGIGIRIGTLELRSEHWQERGVKVQGATKGDDVPHILKSG
jgi:hypothetical protein